MKANWRRGSAKGIGKSWHYSEANGWSEAPGGETWQPIPDAVLLDLETVTIDQITGYKRLYAREIAKARRLQDG